MADIIHLNQEEIKSQLSEDGVKAVLTSELVSCIITLFFKENHERWRFAL